MLIIILLFILLLLLLEEEEEELLMRKLIRMRKLTSNRKRARLLERPPVRCRCAVVRIFFKVKHNAKDASYSFRTSFERVRLREPYYCEIYPK